MREYLPGILGGLIAVILASFATRGRRSAMRGRDGFRALRPGWFLHVALAGSVLMSGVTLLFLLLGGSSRGDADFQNRMAAVMLCVFSASFLWILWNGYLRRISWAGDHIRVTAPGVNERHYRFSDLRGIGRGLDRSDLKLTFGDGGNLKISGYCHGFDDFVANLRRHAPKAVAAVLEPP